MKLDITPDGVVPERPNRAANGFELPRSDDCVAVGTLVVGVGVTGALPPVEEELGLWRRG